VNDCHDKDFLCPDVEASEQWLTTARIVHVYVIV